MLTNSGLTLKVYPYAIPHLIIWDNLDRLLVLLNLMDLQENSFLADMVGNETLYH